MNLKVLFLFFCLHNIHHWSMLFFIMISLLLSYYWWYILLLLYKILKIIKHCAVTAKQQCVVQRWPLPFFTGRLIIIIHIVVFFLSFSRCCLLSAAKKGIFKKLYSIIWKTSKTELLPHTHRKTWEGHALKKLVLSKFYCFASWTSLNTMATLRLAREQHTGDTLWRARGLRPVRAHK